MAKVTQERIDKVVQMLWLDVYEAEFRGKERGRFMVTRTQLKTALNTDRLHGTTICALQDAALATGLVIIDLDDVFPCIETRMVRRYRRPPSALFSQMISTTFPEDAAVDDESPDDDDEE